MWVVFAYILAGCNGNTATHGEHEHEAHEHEAHEHEEGHDHDHEGHDHEHEGHDHEHEEAGEGHAGEISFKKALAEAVGLQTSKVGPGAFTDVIKTSGRVMAAQGEESTVVATVPGVVTFGNLSFVDGTAVRKGQAILSLASSSLSDGNVAAKAKYAYENAKKVYERMEMIDEAKKIYFLGIGSSRAISQFMFWHVKRLGFNAECVNEGGLGLYEAFSHIKKGDVVIIFAFPRFLNDEIKAVKLAKEKKAKIITITSNVFSEISFLSNIVFKISVENNGFFNSYIVPMELCNIILTALFEKNKTSIYAELKENSLVKDFLFTSEN